MTDFKIENDIPMPKNRHKYPWREMKVGDSFFVAGGTIRHSGVAFPNKAYHPKEWTARTVEGGIRIWRVK